MPEIKQKNEFYPGNKRDYIDSDNNKIENLISPIKMMLPIKKKEVKFGEGWYFYQKEPCFRAIAEINSGQVLCYSSHQISFKKTFLTICENLKKLNKNMIIEGEIIVKRTNSSEASEKLLRQYHREPQGVEIFKITDIIGFEEKNLRNTAYWRRLKILETIDLPEGIELKKIDEKFDPNSSGPYYAKHSNSKYKSGVSTAFVDFKVEDENDGESGQLLHNDWKKIEKEEKDKPIGKFERARFNELRSNDYCQIEKGPLITNLSRVLWPDEQYSKDDLYEYYKKVSKVIIKYLKYRPLALMRYPRGINGGGFFQKDLTGYTPSWLETIKMRSKSKGVINYPLCQNENSLLYLVNMCCIEFKPWLTMVNDLYCPKEIVINITGKSRENFDQVIEVAQNFYDTLKRLNIETFCKTNGDDGLNIIIPLIAEYKYAEVRNFAKKLCELVHNKIPDLTQLEGSVSGNEGASKIMLDYMQNCYGQSVIAPYSVRAVPNANVSAPVFWSEVKSGLSPDQFNIKTMIPRLEKLGDIWEPRHEFAYDVIDCVNKLPNAS